jgi:hypothetical protein
MEYKNSTTEQLLIIGLVLLAVVLLTYSIATGNYGSYQEEIYPGCYC